MALYLGNEKKKLILNGVVYRLISYPSSNIVDGIMALSSDNYILQDANGLYITTKEAE